MPADFHNRAISRFLRFYLCYQINTFTPFSNHSQIRFCPAVFNDRKLFSSLTNLYRFFSHRGCALRTTQAKHRAGMVELVQQSKTQGPQIVAWSVRNSNRYWFIRWPEYLAATFLMVMYVFTIISLKEPPVVTVEHNASKPNSEVYFHQIIQRQSIICFSLYEDYLAELAKTYPALHFNVIFMIDDTLQTDRGANVYSRLMQIPSKVEALSNFQISNGLKIKKFQQKYQNVEVTITTLSKYMDRTNLKWRTIPLSYLSFFARIYSVWQTGGIGIDLPLHNITDIQFYLPMYSIMQYHTHRLIYPNKRLAIILKHHNDGIIAEDYRRMLDSIQMNKHNFVSLISNIVNEMVNYTTDFFSFNTTWPLFGSQEQLNTSNSLEAFSENIIKTDTSTNVEADEIELVTDSTTDPEESHKRVLNKTLNKNSTENEITNKTDNNFWKIFLGGKEENNTMKSFERLNNTSSKENNIDEYDYVLSYQLYVLSDGPGLMYFGNLNSEKEELPMEVNYAYNNNPHKSVPSFLTITLEGSFVASTSVKHPLLGHLLSLGDRQLSPKVAIEEAFLARCAGSSKNDDYCSNIHLLNLD